MERQPQIVNSGLIRKTFTHAYVQMPLIKVHSDILGKARAKKCFRCLICFI